MGSVASEVLGINVAGHADLEILLNGFNRAYNRRRQRVLQGSSPRQKVNERIGLVPSLASPLYKPAAPDDLMAKVDASYIMPMICHKQTVNMPSSKNGFTFLRLTRRIRGSGAIAISNNCM